MKNCKLEENIYNIYHKQELISLLSQPLFTIKKKAKNPIEKWDKEHIEKEEQMILTPMLRTSISL